MASYDKFSSFYALLATRFLCLPGTYDNKRPGVTFLYALWRLRRHWFTYISYYTFCSGFNAFHRALFGLSVFYGIYYYFKVFRKCFHAFLLMYLFASGARCQRAPGTPPAPRAPQDNGLPQPHAPSPGGAPNRELGRETRGPGHPPKKNTRQPEHRTRAGSVEGQGSPATALPATCMRTTRSAFAALAKRGSANSPEALAHQHTTDTRRAPEGQPDHTSQDFRTE